MEFRDSFEAITLGKPLLNGIEDYEHIAKLIREIACKHEAVLMMGHGTRHHSNAAYCMLEDYLRYRGIRNVYVATVEGFPVLEHAISKMRGDAVGKVTLMPFMIVAGDHAKNDMAGEGEDSWKSVLVSQGFEVDMQMSGLGDYEAVAELFYQHARNAEQIEQG